MIQSDLEDSFETMRRVAMTLKDTEFEAYVNREMARLGKEYKNLCDESLNKDSMK
jgi:hypothetical protein